MNKNSQEYVAFGFEKKRTPKFGGSVIAGSLKGRAAGHRREALSFLLLRLHSSASLFSSKQQMYCSSLVGRLESIKSRYCFGQDRFGALAQASASSLAGSFL
jgi:hypothetical protein